MKKKAARDHADLKEPLVEAHETVQPFPVVGIGCSAGGLDALKKFFSAMPADSGMAFVLLQHLDPTHKSLMVELLAHHTAMKVVQIENNTPVEPNTIHVIPPNTSLTIKNGVLLLGKAMERGGGGMMPVDHFLTSLAEDQQENAVCIILSGTGTDGTLGLKEIKARGGLALVEDPATAQFDGMPRSAGATGLADYILPVEQMPAVLVSYASQAGRLDQLGEFLLAKAEGNLQKILSLLHAKTGHDFRCYKKNTLLRRLERRMTVNHVSELDDYVEYLQQHPEELEALDRNLLISVTSFFRDPEVWKAVEEKVIGKLIDRCSENQRVRVWVPGCASGEEAYSLAMLLLEEAEKRKVTCPVQIYATDIDKEALEAGRRGVYPENIAGQVSPERLARFFVRAANGIYQGSKCLREMVVFAHQNLISDPPFSKLDLICCRNVLIYMQGELQNKVMALFHFALRDGGFLVLGNSESVGQRTDLFEPLSKRLRIYRQVSTVGRIPLDLPLSMDRRRGEMFLKREAPPAPRFADIAKSRLMQRFVPPSVLVNSKNEVLFFSGVTRDFLFFPEGIRTDNILDMADPGLKSKLRTALHKAGREKREVVLGGIRLSHGDGEQAVRLTVLPVPEGKDEAGLFLISFEYEAAAPPPAALRIEDTSGEALIRSLEEELKRSQEELQSMMEQMDSANEELKVSNEETMSMNEELQSTNEELETSREELQSLNEELSTMNSQLQEKVTDLEVATNDMNNLLTSTNIATIFLSPDFQIKRYTPAATELMNLIPADIGRPLKDITCKFSDDALFDEAKSVLKNLVPVSKEVASNDGKWFIRSIQPYRTREDKIQGVVVTFTDITERKRAEEELQKSEERFRLLVANVKDFGIFMLDPEGRVVTWNAGAERLQGYKDEEIIGEHFSRFFTPEDLAGNKPEKELQTAREIGQAEGEGWWVRKDGSLFWASVMLTALRDEKGRLRGFAEITRDITEPKRAGEEIQRLNNAVLARNEQLESANKELEAFVYSVAHDLRGPLRHIAGFSSLLMKDIAGKLDEKGRQYLARIHEGTEKMSRLIDDLLNLSQVSRQEIKRQEVNISEIAAATIKELRAAQPDRSVEVDIEGGLTAFADPGLVGIVLANLLDNAWKFTGKTEHARIEVRSLEQDGKIICCVRDNGAGFDQQYVGKLFAPFHRLHEESEFDGTGIGLALVSRIISRHEGKIWADGKVGEGATFCFSFT